MKLLSDRRWKDLVVLAPDDHCGVRDIADTRGEVGFPEREGVPDGHDGFDDAGASAVSVGPCENGRREKLVIVNDFFQDRISDQPAEQPIAE